MFARATFVLLVLPLLAVAVALPGGGPNQCNTGPVQCCNSVQSADNENVAGLLGVLGIIAQGATGQVGFDCNPISGIAIAGNSCSAQPVCCENNQFNGLIAVGCNPINVNV
ncbi:putative hydrophobins [Lyophyllum shimeji]|uniref:Hydrophobin n=1 Tax=Lyophyllum shimeji TaxID=47721 RepID=A0A9P3UTK5_LYOSH|nr:putative hydrophobins [Lyophyllum shimeji]